MLTSSSFRWYTSLFSVVVVSAAVVVFSASALVVTNATATATLGGTTTTTTAVTEDAEEARWLIATGSWGTASFQSPDGLRSAVVSYADDEGTIYFYLMGAGAGTGGTGSSNTGFFADAAAVTTTNAGVTFTVSEAALAPTSNFGHAACGTHGQADPEDPRCAKLSIQGTLTPCHDDRDAGHCTHRGQAVLFARHPEMATWPVDHHFTVYTLTIHDLWMISNYGGGSSIPSAEYYAVTPQHHPKYTTTQTAIDVSSFSFSTQKKNLLRPRKASTEGVAPHDVPAWNQKVARTRWIVGHSLWTTVSTTSVRLNGAAWGNIRSIVDGELSTTLEDSTGTPVFYLPTPDPTNVDVLHDATIALSFSEASLTERLDPETHTKVCNGLDPMDPLCGQVMMVGTAVKIDGTPATTLHAFKTRHPLAPWLSEGGAHTGGNYYTIQPTYITLLDYYGGATDISIDEYLAWTPGSVTMTTTTRPSKGTVAAAAAVMTAKLLRGVSD